MQNAYNAWLCTQPLRIMTKTIQHAPRYFKQQVVEYFGFIQGQAVKGIRKRKYDVKIWNRQKFLFSCLYPFFSLGALALGTMPVAATVITDTQMTTTAAAIYMAAQCGGTTSSYSIEGSQLPTVKTTALTNPVPMRV